MVPESHEIAFPTSPELREYVASHDFRTDVLQKLREQYVVELLVQRPKTEPIEGNAGETRTMENLLLTYTRNNAGGLKDAIDFLSMKLVGHGLDASTMRGAIPRPKSDSFEDSMPYFDSKLLQRAEPPVSTESPTRAGFEESEQRSVSIFGKLRKPGSISSFSSFLDRRKTNGSSTPASLFKHASSNASKASLVSMESRESGYRNPWNDSGIDLEHDALQPHNSWGSFSAAGSRPATSSASLATYESKFPFGAGNASSTSLNTPMIPGLGGDVTPRYDAGADGLSTNGNAASSTIATSSKATPSAVPAAASAATESPKADASSAAPGPSPATLPGPAK